MSEVTKVIALSKPTESESSYNQCDVLQIVKGIVEEEGSWLLEQIEQLMSRKDVAQLLIQLPDGREYALTAPSHNN